MIRKTVSELFIHRPAELLQSFYSWIGNSILLVGRKRRFLFVGIANVLLTNLLLQSLIYLIPSRLLLSTFLSQAFNGVFGCFVYGKFVFNSFNSLSGKSITSYFVLMVSIWILNSLGIRIGSSVGLSQSVAAITMIPALAVFSYNIQKYFVFKK